MTIQKSEIQLSKGQLVIKDMIENATINLNRYEVKVYKAILGEKIREYSPEGLVMAVKDLFSNLIKDTGIRTNFDINLITRIVDILITYYGHLTLDEIRMGFELSFIGRLNEFLPRDKFGQPDPNHYNSLSMEYIGKILNAYIKYRQSFILKINDHQKETKSLPQNIDYKSLLVERFEYYKKTGELPIMFYSRVSAYLTKYGLQIVSDREIIEGYKRIQLMKRTNNNDSIYQMKDLVNDYMMGFDISIAEVSVKEYFDYLIRNKIDFKELLNKE